MRGVDLVKWIRRCSATAVLLTLSAAFFAVLTSVGQLQIRPPLRVEQIIDQFVIDLEDASAEDVPRYNLLALADLDDDGNVDLVAVDTEADELNLYFGDGSGLFDDPVIIEAVDADDDPFSPIAIVIGDFTGPFENNGGAPDGNLDIAMIDELSTIAIMIGDGEGGFAIPDQFIEDLESAFDASGAVAADFDGDGNLDLAIADFDQVLFVCNREGTFGHCATPLVVLSEAEGTDIVDLAVGDFNGDDRPDVVAVVAATGLAYPIFSTGGGNFESGFTVGLPVDVPNPVVSLAVADFNGDGVDDFVTLTENFQDGGQVSLGARNRVFRNFLFAVDPATSAAAGDFGEDGVADIVFAVTSNLAIIEGAGTGDFSQGQGQNATERGVNGRRLGGALVLRTADLNNDGLLDVVGLTANGTEIQVALNVSRLPTVTPEATSPPGTPTPPMSPTPSGPTPTFTPVPPTATPTSLPTAPLGRCDYRVSAVSTTGTARGVVAAELNGAGGPDIAVSDGTFVHIIGNSEFFPNTTLRTCAEDQLDGQQPGPPPDLTMVSVAGAADLAVLDLGEDTTGDLEIAVVGTAGISFLMRGATSGLFAPVTSLTVPITGNPTQIVTDYASNPLDQRRRAPLDIDGDGNTDILVANLGSLNVSILYGGSGATAFEQVLLNVGSPTRSIAAGDVNDDGLIDFVVAATNNRIFYVVQRASSGARPEFFIGGTFDAGSRVEALQTGFFNDDARADVFFVDSSPRARVLVSNPGNLSNPTQFAAFPITGPPSAVATLLFDPIDARLDAVVAVPGANHLAFGLGAGDGGFGTLLQPLATGPGPRDIAVADVDVDTQFDVVTANADGSVSILISSAPPPTPTPTVTPTSTETGTPTMTGTATPSMTETTTPAGTNTPVVNTPTPTNTKEGIFELSGSGCAVDEHDSAGAPVGLLLFLAAMAAGRTAARRNRCTR